MGPGVEPEDSVLENLKQEGAKKKASNNFVDTTESDGSGDDSGGEEVKEEEDRLRPQAHGRGVDRLRRMLPG